MSLKSEGLSRLDLLARVDNLQGRRLSRPRDRGDRSTSPIFCCKEFQFLSTSSAVLTSASRSSAINPPGEVESMGLSLEVLDRGWRRQFGGLLEGAW